jgi:hypothetical protein
MKGFLGIKIRVVLEGEKLVINEWKKLLIKKKKREKRFNGIVEESGKKKQCRSEW